MQHCLFSDVRRLVFDDWCMYINELMIANNVKVSVWFAKNKKKYIYFISLFYVNDMKRSFWSEIRKSFGWLSCYSAPSCDWARLLKCKIVSIDSNIISFCWNQWLCSSRTTNWVHVHLRGLRIKRQSCAWSAQRRSQHSDVDIIVVPVAKFVMHYWIVATLVIVHNAAAISLYIQCIILAEPVMDL